MDPEEEERIINERGQIKQDKLQRQLDEDKKKTEEIARQASVRKAATMKTPDREEMERCGQEIDNGYQGETGTSRQPFCTRCVSDRHYYTTCKNEEMKNTCFHCRQDGHRKEACLIIYRTGVISRQGEGNEKRE